MAQEQIDHPAHYNQGKFEVIDVIEAWGLGFNDGNAVKYLARARHKGNELTDLKKAAWYLRRESARADARRSPCDTEGAGLPLSDVIGDWCLSEYLGYALTAITQTHFRLAADFVERRVTELEEHSL